MSIKHALLALLDEEPLHGYELKTRFDEALGSLWPLQQAQIYNNLRLLEKAGHIELDERIEQTDLPDRKNFRLTEAGHKELSDWAASPVRTNRQLKDEFYLKLTTLINVMGQDESVVDLLWAQRQEILQHLRELERTLLDVEADNDTLMAVLIEGVILHAEADLAWLDRVEMQLAISSSATAGSDIAGGGS